MKKIPTLFERTFKDHNVVAISDKVHEGMEWVLQGEGEATLKIDGACCAIINGEFYKRYDAKHGKKAPEGAIPCGKPDPITGHFPHWLKVTDCPADKWFIEAYNNTVKKYGELADGTYEAVGKHFRSNFYHLEKDWLIKHGIYVLEDVPRTFEGIRQYLQDHAIEGIVFWKDKEPKCKIKRKDFGFAWSADVAEPLPFDIEK